MEGHPPGLFNFVACFLLSLGAVSKRDEPGGNSKSVRSTELMMECNDCLKDGMISQKVTKCWVILGTVTIAFVQPVTG